MTWSKRVTWTKKNCPNCAKPSVMPPSGKKCNRCKTVAIKPRVHRQYPEELPIGREGAGM